MTTRFTSLGLALALGMAGLTGCAAAEERAGVESSTNAVTGADAVTAAEASEARQGSFDRQIEGSWAVTRGAASPVGEGGTGGTTTMTPGSVAITFPKAVTLDAVEAGMEHPEDEVPFAVRFTVRVPSLGIERTVSATAGCFPVKLGGPMSAQLFDGSMCSVFRGPDQVGGHWSATVDFDDKDEFFAVRVKGSHQGAALEFTFVVRPGATHF